jgi:hypothetical protein
MVGIDGNFGTDFVGVGVLVGTPIEANDPVCFTGVVVDELPSAGITPPPV